MKKRVKNLWVEALRSGEYEQGREKLLLEGVGTDGGDRFCCLGVLTDLYVRETGDVAAWDGFCAEKELLAGKVVRWAGLGEPDPDLAHGLPATHYNDDKRLGFDRLADMIDESL